MRAKIIFLLSSLFFVSCEPSYAQSTGGVDGTLSATTTVAQLPSNICGSLIIQNDAGSSNAVKVGYTSSPALALAVGGSVTLRLQNSSQAYVKSVSGTATVNWACGN